VRFRIASLCVLLGAFAFGAAACGSSKSSSATNATDGVTISVAGDKVTLKRSPTSSTGTGGEAGEVACTTDYRQLAAATIEPAPTDPWYAATLITWPQVGQSSTARLSHSLSGTPDLCIAEMSDHSAQAVVYFRPGVQTGVEETQQEAQPSSVLQAVAATAKDRVKKNALPTLAVLASSLKAEGMFVTTAKTVAGVREPGALYLITGKSTPKVVVAAIMDNTGTVQTVTQGVTGKAKLATVKSK
jgi:hypothetical protein